MRGGRKDVLMRKREFCLVGLLLLSSLSTALADGVIPSIVTDFKRVNCWPKPFDGPDRQAARAPFAIMVSNGWHRQNLLGDYHFRDDGQLTDSGELKLRWIVYECPPQHRAVFVHMANSPQVTDARMAAVSRSLQRLAPPEQSPPVAVTAISDQGWPASRADAVGRAFDKSTPEPRLPTLERPKN
jgi:hypothetical protein